MNEIEVFQSKRNHVSLIKTEQGYVVQKVFAFSSDAVNESAVYRLLEGKPLRTAKVLQAEGNRIQLSWLPGITFVELLERQEVTKPVFPPWEGLVDWLIRFRQLTGLVMTDVNLRNFLYDEKNACVAGVDFEQCRSGRIEDMLSCLCAYVLLYDVPFTMTKKMITDHILDYCVKKGICELGIMQEQTEREILRLRSRRNKKTDRADERI